MKPKQFSIRYKILLLLTLIPIIALGTYGLLALKVFREDKIAYVFDSSRNISASIATQIKTELNAGLSTARTLFQDFLFQGKFTNLSEKVFEGSSQLEAVGVFILGSDKRPLAPNARLEKSPGLFEAAWSLWGSEANTIFDEALQKKRIVKTRKGDDRILIIESLSQSDRPENYIFVIVTRVVDLKEVFSESQGMQAVLADGLGKVVFGPEEYEGISLSEKIPVSFFDANSSKITQGAETIRDSKKRDLLVSFSDVGFSDLKVVTWVDQKKALSATQLLVRKSTIFFIVMISLVVIISLLISKTLTESLTSLFEATQRVSEGKFDLKVNVTSNDEIGTLAENFNLMAGEVSRLLVQTAEKARMENELQTAKTVQETLFPPSKARVGSLEISGFYEPSSECGGDWWHYCRVGDRVLLWIGDATGHGAPAALITSAAKSAATIIEILDVTPAHAMEILNRCIYDVSKGKIMMTFFLASFDLQTSVLTYANASHEAPFIIKKADGPLQKRDLLSLNEVISPRLGQARETKYEETSIQLGLEDLVFFYTDGVSDVQNLELKTWGERNFIKALVEANQNFPTADISVKRFVESLQKYRKGASLIDDVTFFAIKNQGS